MRATSLSHLSNGQLIGTARALVARHHVNLADLIWHLAEIDARKLYLEKAYPSMLEFCIEELGMTEDVALKRISVARVAREHPRVVDYLAGGRLNLSVILTLRSYLGAAKPAELFEAASRKTREQVEQMLAERFPKTESMELIEAVPADAQRAVANGDPVLAAESIFLTDDSISTCAVASLAPGRVTAPRPEIRPVATERFKLHLMMGKSLRDKIEYAKRLFSHQTNDVAELMEQAFELLIVEGEKTKFAATERPQKKERPTKSTRHIPNRVKRAVWQRDGGRCTYVSPDGKRCGCMTRPEYDHILPVARGGKSTVDNLRLRCHGHNQYEAERVFGSGFMEQKRADAGNDHTARPAGEPARSGGNANPEFSRNERPALTPEQVARHSELDRAAAAETEIRTRAIAACAEVLPYLNALGIRGDAARRASQVCLEIPDATLEERVKRALASFGGPTRRAVSST